MHIYLPIAEMAISVETIFFISIGVGFLSSLFGIGGGFLTTPFLIFIGIPPGVAVGTQTAQMVASSTAGVFGHWSKGNVDLKIGLVMLSGGFFGTFLGVSIFKILQSLGQVDLVISILYIILLGGIGSLMLTEGLKSLFFKQKSVRAQFNTFKLSPFLANLPFKMRFPRSNMYVSVLVPAGLGFFGGLLAAILGIGGGFLLVPAMIYMLGMPTLLVAGTSLFQMIFTTSFALIMHAIANQTVDIVLAVILILGSVIGAQFGVIFSGKIKPTAARIILACIVLAVCFRLVGQLFIMPNELYSTMLEAIQ